MTTSEMLEAAQTELNDSSDRTKTILLAGFNRGLRTLRSKLRREYTLVTKKFNLSEGEGQYQAPEDIIRGGTIKVVIDGRTTRLRPIHDENKWIQLTETAQTAERPEYVRWLQPDIFEMYPAPDADVTNGGRITYQAKAKPLGAEDYTTGTIDVNNGSATVTGSETTWDVSMIGKVLKLTGDEPHQDYYKIVDVASATELTIENFWQGANISGKNYRIGDQPNLPSEYHDSLVDKGIERVMLARKDKDHAREYGGNFLIDSDQAEADYEGLEESAVIESKHVTHDKTFDPLNQVREVD